MGRGAVLVGLDIGLENHWKLCRRTWSTCPTFGRTIGSSGPPGGASWSLEVFTASTLTCQLAFAIRWCFLPLPTIKVFNADNAVANPPCQGIVRVAPTE